MIADLAEIKDKSVDKASLFAYLLEKYMGIITQLDDKLASMLDKTGYKLFNYSMQPKSGPGGQFNPMALMQSVMGGGGFDMGKMMNMMQGMQGSIGR